MIKVFRYSARLLTACTLLMLMPGLVLAQINGFHVEETSIAGIQNAIRSGQTTCKAVVPAYIDRAKAYSGMHHPVTRQRADSAATVSCVPDRASLSRFRCRSIFPN
jgi:hypothetical protein